MMILPAQANDQADWQEYAGQYVLSFDNSEETVAITLQGDSTLTAFSPLGEVALRYAGEDRFEFPQYGGVIVFERDEKRQIVACTISVAAIDMKELKARKQ
jgi:sorbitol-specific phosphotransferase system component IIA